MGSKFTPFYYINVVKQTNHSFSGAVVFFHGADGSGNGLRDWIRSVLGQDLTFPHLMLNYPTAPSRMYTARGENSSIWFDRTKHHPKVEDVKESVNESCEHMAEFVSEQVAVGMPLERIVLGGFSMGGTFSLHLGLRYLPKVAGIFTLSSYLNHNSLVYQEMKNAPSMPVFMCHGDKDNIVPFAWGKDTYDKLRNKGVQAEFHVLKDTYHELVESEIQALRKWILKVLPA